MSNEIVIKETQHVEYIEKNKDLIGNQNKLSGTDLQNFLIQCKRTGLDPITRQIYAIPMQGKLNIMASIDGLRLIAERSGAYEGQTAPQWCGEDGIWKDIWLSNTPPKAAKVGVYKTKFREALFAVALFDEYAKKTNGTLDFMWKKMPALMISKVAESLALRKAFPNEMSGIYSADEMDQALPEKEVNITAALDGAKKENVIPSNEIDINYVMKCGNDRVKNKKLIDIASSDLESTVNYFRTLNKPLTGIVKEGVETAEAYLKKIKTKAEPKLDESEVIPF